MNLDIVVVNYRTDHLLEKFLQSVEDFYPQLKNNVTVFDVQSDTQWDQYRTLNSDNNCGYAKACNLGAQVGDSEFIGFFNADTRFTEPETLERCISAFSDVSVGAVGPMQVDTHGRITHAGIGGTHRKPRHIGWKAKNIAPYQKSRNVISVSGAAYITKRSVWEEMTNCPIYQEVFPGAEGGFLPTPLYYEETGYSYHLSAHGYDLQYVGSACMIHEHNKSPGTSVSKTNKAVEGKRLFVNFCEAHGIEHN